MKKENKVRVVKPIWTRFGGLWLVTPLPYFTDETGVMLDLRWKKKTSLSRWRERIWARVAYREKRHL